MTDLPKNAPPDAAKKLEEARLLAESCPNKFTEVHECLALLFISGLFYLAAIILLENYRENKLRASEKK